MSVAEPSLATPRRGGRRPGVVLAVMMAVLFAVSLAAAVLTPRWQASRRADRARATVAQLRQFEALFQQYAAQHGDWPASAAPGAVPAGMDGALAQTGWSAPSPFGGHYMWQVNTVHRGIRVHAGIALVNDTAGAPMRDRRDLEELLAAAAADKNAAHRLRLGFRDEPIYVLEN